MTDRCSSIDRRDVQCTFTLKPYRAAIRTSERLRAAARRLGQLGQVGFGPRSQVADHLGGAEAPELRAGFGLHAMGEAVQEARREQVTRPGRVDHPFDGSRTHVNDAVRRDHHRPARTAREGGEDPGLLHVVQGGLEGRGPKEGDDLVLVGEQDVDLAGEQIEELAAVALDAEGVREAEGDGTVVLVAHLDGAAHGVLCRWEVPEVALE